MAGGAEVMADISIHALREEGDWAVASSTPPPTNFYPRPPRGGRRYKTALKLRKVEFLSTPSARRATGPCKDALDKLEFLSTPSARRATAYGTARTAITEYFYPRPPRGGRPADQHYLHGIL